MKFRSVAFTLAWLAISFGPLLFSAGMAGQIEHRRLAAKTYPGSRDRDYKVFVPTSYTAQAPAPMAMVLHGCRQTDENMITETRFRELAERDGFIAIYPFITSYDGLRSPNCWGFFMPRHIREGAGEAEDLHQIAREVETAFKVDPKRRYVAGLSSGGAMAVVLAVVRSEYFAAAGAVAGAAYSETALSVPRSCSFPGTFRPIPSVVAAMQAQQRRPEEQRAVPIMTIHSRHDCVIHPLASERIRDSWMRHYGLERAPSATLDCQRQGVPCKHVKYGPPRRSLVETVFYDGDRGHGYSGEGSHYWVGDNPGPFANPRGPSASDLLWSFFKQNAFVEREPPR